MMKVGATATPTTTSHSTLTSGDVIADSGFQPSTNGFSFQNYAKGYQDLTPVEMERLFGPAVCGAQVSGACVLTPAGRQWMEHYNNLMARGGHCYGLSVLSTLFFEGEAKPIAFGAPETPELELDGNTSLQREIAYSWTFQALGAVRRQAIKGTPSTILDTLIRTLDNANRGGETYTLAFVNRQGRGGLPRRPGGGVARGPRPGPEPHVP